MSTIASNPRTLLLAIGDNSLAQFQLTDTEMAEAEEFFILRTMEDTQLLELEALHTKNIGFQYLIARDDTPRFVEILSRNIHLHLEIVPLIIDHCQRYELGGYNPTILRR